MKGWLLINGFIKTKSFNETYSHLLKAAKNRGITLELKKNDELIEIYEKPDFVLFWDKDVFLAKRLENTGIPVFNPSSGIEKSDSKILTYFALEKENIPTPKTIISPKTYENIGYTDFSFLKKAAEILSFPMVVKEAFGSFGKQVYLVYDIDELKTVVEKIGHKDFLMQEFISESRGRDLRINVVGDKIVNAIERYNENDFRANVENGGKAREFFPTEEQKNLAVKTVKALGLCFGGVDILFSEKGDIVCEVNSNPHFSGALEATGKNLADSIIDFVINKI